MLTFKNYDDAVIEYFQKLYKWSVFATPDKAFEIAGLNFGDRVPLPLISVYRSEFGLNPTRNTALFFRGRTLALNDEKIDKERVLPLIFSYQMDVWGNNEEQLSAMFAELLFAVLENPLVEIKFDGFDEPFKFNLSITEAQSNSEAIQVSSRGRLYRFTAIYQVYAYIVKLEERDRIKVIPEFFDYTGGKLS